MAKKNAVELEDAPVEVESTGTPRPRKIAKSITDTVVTIEVLGQSVATYDFASLPEDIKAKLGVFGLSSKLGDAAAGKSGSDAAAAIAKVYEALVAGEMTARSASSSPKATMNSIRENLAKLSPEERATAEALLAGLGVKL